MIEVQMSVDDYRDRFRPNPRHGAQRFIERSFPVDAVHRAMLVRPFVTDPGVNQNALTITLDEQTIHVHANAVLFVGGTGLRPQVARHYAEHRTAIEAKFTVRDDFDAIVTKLH